MGPQKCIGGDNSNSHQQQPKLASFEETSPFSGMRVPKCKQRHDNTPIAEHLLNLRAVHWRGLCQATS